MHGLVGLELADIKKTGVSRDTPGLFNMTGLNLEGLPGLEDGVLGGLAADLCLEGVAGLSLGGLTKGAATSVVTWALVGDIGFA